MGAALTTILPGGRQTARAAFGFDVAARRSGSLHEAAAIAATNLRFAAAILLLTRATVHPLTRAVALTLTAGNAALVGVAAGAYGLAALPVLLHVPLEWAGLAAALVGRPAAAIALLAAAALVESCISG